MTLPSFPLNRFCPLTELGACRQRSFVFSAAAELAPRALTRRSQLVSILQTSASRSEIAKLYSLASEFPKILKRALAKISIRG